MTTVTLTCPPDMRWCHIPALTQQTLMLTAGGRLCVDFSAVEQIDSSALSLLFVWQRRARAARCMVCLHQPPASLSELARLYGVEDLLPAVVQNA